MKAAQLLLIIVLLFGVSVNGFAAGRGGGGGRGGGWHGGGGRGGSWHGGGWHGGGRPTYRPFRGGHFGWAPAFHGHGVWMRPGYVWPYGVPWFVYPAVVPGYTGPIPDGVAIQPPAPSVVLHAGEMTGMNVGQRFIWHCDNPQALVPTLESADEDSLALILRGNAPGEANCSVCDGESAPLLVHVVILPAAATEAAEPPLPPDPTPAPNP